MTLTVQARGVRIVPEVNRTNDNAPSHRVFVGRAEIGAAWPKRSNVARRKHAALSPILLTSVGTELRRIFTIHQDVRRRQ